MKKVFLSALLIWITNLGLTQTKIIAYKSHSGARQGYTFALENDNFGELPTMHLQTIFDTVQIISDSQFVEVWHLQNPNYISSSESPKHFMRDTHLIAPAYRASANEIQNNYPSTTVFQGKVKSKKTKKIHVKTKTKTTKLWLFCFLIGGGFIPYLVHQFTFNKKQYQ